MNENRSEKVEKKIQIQVNTYLKSENGKRFT